MKKLAMGAMCATLLMSATITANAALVRASFVGIAQQAEAGNAYGLEAGDFVFGAAIFDTDWLANPFPAPDDVVTVILHEANPLYQLSLSIGNRTFTESEYGDWPNDPIFPTLGFFDGSPGSSLEALENSWLGVAMNTCGGELYPNCATQDGLSYDGFAMGWSVSDNGVQVASGVWRLNSIKIQAVPVPAALPLFLGALGLLAGYRRRR